MDTNVCYDYSPLGVFHLENEYAIVQGGDWDVSLIYQENGTAVDFSTGYTARMQVRTDYGKQIIIELSSASGTIVLASGIGDTPNCVLKFLASQTTPLTVYNGIYDLEVTEVATGKVLKFLEGRWELRREVTI